MGQIVSATRYNQHKNVALARMGNTMKQAIRHRLTLSMALCAVAITAGTYVAVDAYPVAVAIIWAAYAVTLTFAIVAIRRDLKNA
jgi:hypothetical protein